MTGWLVGQLLPWGHSPTFFLEQWVLQRCKDPRDLSSLGALELPSRVHGTCLTYHPAGWSVTRSLIHLGSGVLAQNKTLRPRGGGKKMQQGAHYCRSPSRQVQPLPPALPQTTEIPLQNRCEPPWKPSGDRRSSSHSDLTACHQTCKF